jgi:hypothetical protein
MDNIKLSLALFAPLPVVGVLTGVIAGWWGVIRADGAQAVASESTPLYLALALLLPIVLFITTTVSRNIKEFQGIYQPLPTAVIYLSIIAIIGTLFASGLFIVAIFQIASVFGGEAPVDMMEALSPSVFQNAPLVIGITLITGIVSAILANRVDNPTP